MDAPEHDYDAALQRVSGDLINEIDRSLPVILRGKQSTAHPTQSRQPGHLRPWVTVREATRVTTLLDSFQELPQLLDPHLSRWLPQIAAAYLEALLGGDARDRERRASDAGRAKLLQSLPSAVCKILYTFCKVRGEKVVVRFLSNEARYLEPLLSALESADASAVRAETGRGVGPTGTETAEPWEWEQRYIVLLWLSHLLLAPFDLSTISSAEPEDSGLPAIPNFVWPRPGPPGITARVLPLAVKYLASPGKERDAARAVLVRLAVRRDMQELGIQDALVDWALAALRPAPDPAEAPQTPYFYIGVLSFLAGVIESAHDVADIARAVREVCAGGNPVADTILASGMARKMIIKVMRSIAVTALRQPTPDAVRTEAVENIIGHLLESTADGDTPVRLAASKGLSVVVQRLDAEMAAQVVDAVLEGLNRNVLWAEGVAGGDDNGRVRDVSGVDPLEWHGLMLTLAHLLYRRSPPPEVLPDILQALLLGLSFEQRSTSGGSVGANIRDAACFGIWALARRYTTTELLAVEPKTAANETPPAPPPSILQILSTALVDAACLDPAGNIRRGASAALQELVGRHPDMVAHGIRLVQTVDYHAVALRTRAINEVALGAARLSGVHGEALGRGLLGWRGVGDADAGVRRAAGGAYGPIVAELVVEGLTSFGDAVAVMGRLRMGLQTRQVDELHGLLLAYAAVLDEAARAGGSGGRDMSATFAEQVTDDLAAILGDGKVTQYRKPELVAEAASRLVVSALPILVSARLRPGGGSVPNGILRPGPEVLLPEKKHAAVKQILECMGSWDSLPCASPPPPADRISEIASSLEDAMSSWLAYLDTDTVAAVSQASSVLLLLSPPASRFRILQSWAAVVERVAPGYKTEGQETGYLYALAAAHPFTVSSTSSADTSGAPGGDRDLVCGAVRARWAADPRVPTRVAILRAITRTRVLESRPLLFLDVLRDGLNDYTVTARGDEGSLVRLEAIRAVGSLWQGLDGDDDVPSTPGRQQVVSTAFLDVLRLASEKLDRVRTEARHALALVLADPLRGEFLRTSFSAPAYFLALLSLLSSPHVHPLVAPLKTRPGAWAESLLSGFVLSADTGSEDLVMASRAALCELCTRGERELASVCAALANNLRGLLASPAGAGKDAKERDRVLVPTLEVLGFLLRTGVFGRWDGRGAEEGAKATTLRGLCLLAQKAAYKAGNVRKLEACIRVYGGVASLPPVGPEDGDGLRRAEGVGEARRRLGALMLHPWPKVRSLVADEIWGMMGWDEESVQKRERLKGVDWGRVSKETVGELVEYLGIG